MQLHLDDTVHDTLATHHIPVFFFFNDTATTEIYTLSLHDALPISRYYDFLHRDRRRLHRHIDDRPPPDRHLRGAIADDREDQCVGRRWRIDGVSTIGGGQRAEVGPLHAHANGRELAAVDCRGDGARHPERARLSPDQSGGYEEEERGGQAAGEQRAAGSRELAWTPHGLVSGELQ